MYSSVYVNIMNQLVIRAKVVLIALFGASIILAADNQPLPPIHHNANHTRYNLANEVMTPELV